MGQGNTREVKGNILPFGPIEPWNYRFILIKKECGVIINKIKILESSCVILGMKFLSHGRINGTKG